MKSVCYIHRFMYKGERCPLCEKERIDGLAKRYVKCDDDKKASKKDREINESDINRLLTFFGSKK